MKNITARYRYVPIVEPSIRNKQGYAYEEGKKRNVYIQSAEGEDQVGKVWAGLTNFVDYFHPNAT
jgi:alpha-glucosidase (family GH31 glycosyl hydrolase)